MAKRQLGMGRAGLGGTTRGTARVSGSGRQTSGGCRRVMRLETRAVAQGPTSTTVEVEVQCPSEEHGMKCSLERSVKFASCEPGSYEVEECPAPLTSLTPEQLEQAYERCGLVTEYYAKTFYLGTQLMTPEKARAIWAIYVWCRRTDELVDGPHASRITPKALERWDERLEAIFAGNPYDMLDAALADTVRKFPVDIQPFRDMVDGMRMDLVKPRYDNFE